MRLDSRPRLTSRCKELEVFSYGTVLVDQGRRRDTARHSHGTGLMDDLDAAAIAAACPLAGLAAGCGLWLVRVRCARPVVRRYVETLGYQVLRMRPRLFRAWFRRDPLPLSWAPFGGATAYQGVVFRVLIRDRGGRQREIWVQSRGWFAPKLANVRHID